ncbi:hypothetical protein A2U01_0044017, partial [Trifolium medium]|nr:hypothetical protein [Trifolium medium]
DVVLEQVETQVSNKPLQDQQSASLAPSNRSEPARSSNSSPTSDADKTTSDYTAVGHIATQVGNSPLINQEMTSCNDFIDVLSTIDNFLGMTHDPSTSVLRLPHTSCVVADSLERSRNFLPKIPFLCLSPNLNLHLFCLRS